MVPSYSNSRSGFYEREIFTASSPWGPMGVTYPSRGTCWSQSLTRSTLRQGDFVKPLPWSYTRNLSSALRGVVTYRRASDGVLVRRDDGFLVQRTIPLPPAVSNNLYNEALDRLNDKVRGGIDLSIDLAQAGQTKKMLSALGQFEDFCNDFQNRNLKSAPRLSRAIGSRWLEYRYGWAPLVQTIYDLCNQNARTARNLAQDFRASAVRGIPNFTWDASYNLYTTTVLRPELVQAKGKDVVEIGVRLSNRGADASISQLTSLNPFSIGWEMLPYSFVVDWFYDVGGYIRNLETALLSRNAFVSGYVSTLRAVDLKFERSWAQSFNQGGYLIDYMQMSQSRSYSTFVRTVLGSYPLPRLPSFSAELGSGRLLNAAGLLSQFLGRGR